MPILKTHQKKEFQAFVKNMKWFQANYEKLRERYAGEYVAVNAGQVVMHGKDAQDLIRKLRDEYKDIGAFVVEFVSKEKIELIL